MALMTPSWRVSKFETLHPFRLYIAVEDGSLEGGPYYLLDSEFDMSPGRGI